ncbi:hypothetical protein A2U01_0056669, partial [Trifolium medium]|nr:hypothetical protein [Trifolium medium]
RTSSAMSPDREGAGGVRRSGGGASVHGGVRLEDGYGIGEDE